MPEGKEKSGSLVSISADDFFGLGKVADRVMEALKAGIGPALEPWVRSRLARADQQAARGWVEVTKQAGLPWGHNLCQFSAHSLKAHLGAYRRGTDRPRR
jgi:hypothetical protein